MRLGAGEARGSASVGVASETTMSAARLLSSAEPIVLREHCDSQ